MVDLDPILIIAEIAELAVSDVKTGAVATADLINGLSVTGPITFVSSLASPETRTFSVEVSVPNSDGRVIDGMTATLRLPAQQVMAHSVPPAALTLNDSGAVGVKLVDKMGRVSFAEASASSVSSDVVDGSTLTASRCAMLVLSQPNKGRSQPHADYNTGDRSGEVCFSASWR